MIYYNSRGEAMSLENMDEEYLSLVKEIIIDKDFIKLKECIHHGINRYDHSLKVSYQAYLYAKKKGLDYKSIAVGGLLHDFFLNDEEYTVKKRVVSLFKHPSIALTNSKEKYKLSELEEDIIISHMFPISLKLPKHKESWVVSLVDKKIAAEEFVGTFNYKMRTSMNILILLLFNLLK